MLQIHFAQGGVGGGAHLLHGFARPCLRGLRRSGGVGDAPQAGVGAVAALGGGEVLRGRDGGGGEVRGNRADARLQRRRRHAAFQREQAVGVGGGGAGQADAGGSVGEVENAFEGMVRFQRDAQALLARLQCVDGGEKIAAHVFHAQAEVSDVGGGDFLRRRGGCFHRRHRREGEAGLRRFSAECGEQHPAEQRCHPAGEGELGEGRDIDEADFVAGAEEDLSLHP